MSNSPMIPPDVPRSIFARVYWLDLELMAATWSVWLDAIDMKALRAA